MSTITIYQFTLYNIINDENLTSRRWGTREGISSVGGHVLGNTETEVDILEVHFEMPGLTKIGFSPRKRNLGFQSSVEKP